MRIALINPPHTAIGSRIPGEHLPLLGLLSIGGPLLDAGHQVSLIDAELGPMTLEEIIRNVHNFSPDVVMLGHSGSSTVHATVIEICHALKSRMNDITIIYGGVHPTYHWDEILAECGDVDIIVRGEGEKTAFCLIRAMEKGEPLDTVDGIAFRGDSGIVGTRPARMIRDLDDYRVGWELIDHKRYSFGVANARWLSSFRGVVPTNAVIAVSVVSGRYGATAIR